MKKRKSTCIFLAIFFLLNILLIALCVPNLHVYQLLLYNGIKSGKIELELHTAASFPSSLLFVEDEAFAGTSIESVVFESELTTIGNMAFAGTPLKDVHIPQRTKHIGNDAFPSDSVIHGMINSYAERWAQERKYRFVPDNIWSTCIIPAEYHAVFCLFLFCILLPADFKKKYTIRKNIWALIRSMRPQDRIELYPINYRFP